MDVDVEAIADELYGLVPGRFTEARDAQAARARKAGQPQAAKAITGLRRPTRAAYASNLLVRRRPQEVAAFLELGDALRRAQRSLDGTQLKALSHERHAVVAALARTARQLAGEEGQSLGDGAVHEVEQTLHAALADPDAAGRWSGGRLSTALEPPVGFTGLPAVAPVRPQAPAGDTQRPAARPKPSRAEQRRRVRRAEETRAEAEARASELRAAEQERRDHERALAGADARVAELDRQLREARAVRADARRALAEAAGRARDAARESAAARRRADAAADLPADP
ncbi:hypothetical protein ACFXA3_12600 [Streptomyces sp. NPDC059456]|uniref:hypothetical protein n=1 Tax=Streptomyces sp. NPDC059456 TaxID=3346838 RepID=UPI0036AB9E22